MAGRLFNSRLAVILALGAGVCVAQRAALPFPSPLDPGRRATAVQHTPLLEQYLWTLGDVTALLPNHAKFPWREQQLRTATHLFRASFHLASVPAHATLYIAGPRTADVFLNGKRLAHFASDIDAPIGFHVFHAAAAPLLRRGLNRIAIGAVRGRGIVTADSSKATQQLAYGEVLAVKLLAAPLGNEGPTLLISDASWRSTVDHEEQNASEVPAWATTSFDDSKWSAAASLGAVESNRDFMQWSADAGMYAWPGYIGITAPLETFRLSPVAVTHIFSGQAQLENVEALRAEASQHAFTIITPATAQTPADIEAPAILLDFGREIAGRLLVESNSDSNALLSIAYGESELEALATGLTPDQRGGNYLGTNLLDVPAHGTARGPKSAFRYVHIRFLRGAARSSFRLIQAEGITYPVSHAGAFESSDPLLNRIWETSAYTAHLCMQDDLWDAPKRDRGRWAGDIDVEGRVISEVFGDKALLERTLAQLAPAETKAVNGIPGYTALWFTSLASLYAHSGDADFVRSQHDAIVRALAVMNGSLGTSGLYAPRKGEWPFIDWSPGLYGVTPQAVFGTTLQFIRGYEAAATLLEASGDHEQSLTAQASADSLVASARDAAGRSGDDSLSSSWQMAALAVQSGVAVSADERGAIWVNSLSHVRQDGPSDEVISPYFNLAVLDAMAELGHGRTALDWMRAYWGGMLAEGATSFWESYDLRWPKDTPHLSLQADGTSGFFVSMAHGWSSGPAAWLSEQVLGVRSPQDGYRTVTVAPRLLGLQWARGAVPTPHGPIHVSITADTGQQTISFDIPPGVERSTVSIVSTRDGAPVMLDGKPVKTQTAAEGETLPPLGTGHHTIVYTPAGP